MVPETKLNFGCQTVLRWTVWQCLCGRHRQQRDPKDFSERSCEHIGWHLLEVTAVPTASAVMRGSGLRLALRWIASGNVYVADTGNNTIRKITPDGVVSTLAGLAGHPGSKDGIGTNARFRNPWGVAVDDTGNVFVADMSNDTIRKITPSGLVSTLAGQAGMTGSLDGFGSQARFNAPYGVAVDSAGNVYVSDSANDTIRKITPDGVVSTLAGLPGYAGSTDGNGNDARFWNPQGLAVDDRGNIYVADTGNNTVRKITPTGVVTTLAGLAGGSGATDGSRKDTCFNSPSGVAVDRTGNIYIADTGNHAVRRIAPPPSAHF